MPIPTPWSQRTGGATERVGPRYGDVGGERRTAGRPKLKHLDAERVPERSCTGPLSLARSAGGTGLSSPVAAEPAEASVLAPSC